MTDFSYLNVDNAYKLINQKVTKTPLVTNDYINNLLEAEIYFKLENLQNTVSSKSNEQIGEPLPTLGFGCPIHRSDRIEPISNMHQCPFLHISWLPNVRPYRK